MASPYTDGIPPRLYIAVLNTVPAYITPTLVAHAMLGAHVRFTGLEDPLLVEQYNTWLTQSFRKCVISVNEAEFGKIAALPNVHLAFESKTLSGRNSCAIPLPTTDIPKVLRFANLWSPERVIELPG